MTYNMISSRYYVTIMNSNFTYRSDYNFDLNAAIGQRENNIISRQDDARYYVISQAIKTSVLITIVLTAVFGNALVIVSVLRTPNLRSVANAFVVSLAFADLLVALLVMTFSASQEILGEIVLQLFCV